MSITLRLTPADLSRIRFAISPAFETLAAIRVATGPQGPSHHHRWLAAIRPRLDDLDLRPITLLQPRWGHTPDFLSPPPLGPSASFDDELARIAATPPDRVRAEVELSLRDTPGAGDTAAGRQLLAEPNEVLKLLTDLIDQAWRVLIAPVWPKVRALLDADIAFQSRRLAEGGLDRLFAELHPALRWNPGDHILTRDKGDAEHRDLTGEGLVLLPSAFKWDQVVVVTDASWQPTVVYPARGLGGLWEATTGTTDAALGKLIGASRAEILTGMTEPASTTWLAHRHALAPATVSEHLRILTDAGLVTKERHRHEVRYRRTELGTSLAR